MFTEGASAEMPSLSKILLILICTGASAFFATWILRGLMLRFGIVDTPDPGGRKKHRKPVAYEGGVAIWLGCVSGLLLFTFLYPEFIFDRVAVTGIVVGGTAIVCLGVADDLLDLRPWIKLVGQIAVAVLMHQYGFRIEKLSNPFGGDFLVPVELSYLITALWYAVLMNGINMIDGMDGLAAGIVAISAITLAGVSWDLQHPLAFALAIILLGGCLGFLPFNFIPASIFMGDAGSLLLGFLLGSITLLGSTKAPALLALIVPMLALGLPLFETVFAFIRRAMKGQHPFRADRRHLHHRFLALGFSEKRTVLTFYYITAYFGVTAYVLQRLEARSTLALVTIIGGGMLVLVENMRFLERNRRRTVAPATTECKDTDPAT